MARGDPSCFCVLFSSLEKESVLKGRLDPYPENFRKNDEAEKEEEERSQKVVSS